MIFHRNGHIRRGSNRTPMVGQGIEGNYRVIFVREWPADQVVSLYKEAGWWKEEYDPLGIPALIKGSFLFAVALKKGEDRAVGMGRVISDGVSDAYIQDVVVRGDLRGEGIGGMIVRSLLDGCRERALEWIGLIAEEGTEHFYSELGFTLFPGRPMLFKGDV
jgi:GNAT superfamily N-acetyltransferase